MPRRLRSFASAVVLVALCGSCQPQSGGTETTGGTPASPSGTKPAAPAKPIGSAVGSVATPPVATKITLGSGPDATTWLVTECDVEVHDGVLLMKSGEGWIRLEEPQADFVLAWECRNLKPAEYDSGVHFRAELPKPPAHWPKRFQVNLKTGQEGNLTTVKEAASTGLYKNGEWNKFELRVVGNTAELQINGMPAWKTDQIDAPSGYIGLQSEVTLGGQFEFRNITVKAP